MMNKFEKIRNAVSWERLHADKIFLHTASLHKRQ